MTDSYVEGAQEVGGVFARVRSSRLKRVLANHLPAVRQYRLKVSATDYTCSIKVKHEGQQLVCYRRETLNHHWCCVQAHKRIMSVVSISSLLRPVHLNSFSFSISICDTN